MSPLFFGQETRGSRSQRRISSTVRPEARGTEAAWRGSTPGHRLPGLEASGPLVMPLVSRPERKEGEKGGGGGGGIAMIYQSVFIKQITNHI